MAVKSIIDVQVNDGAFKQFSELFDQYKDALGDSNYQWGQINDKQSDSVKQFQLVTAALLAQNELMKRRKEAANDNETAEKRSSDFWQNTVRRTREVSTNVASITKQLLSWASLGALGGGLLGLGGLWGLDSLAHGVGAGRREALGLGIGYGQRQAFGISYGRFVNPDQYLGGVSEALRDVTLRRTLYGAGLSEGDLAGKNTAQVGSELLLKLKSLADQTPTQMMSQVMQARGVGQFMSLEEFQRLKATPRAEVEESVRYNNQLSSKLALSDPAAKAWQDFSRQLSAAGAQIKNSFVLGLSHAHIPEQLTKLSSSLSKAIDTLLKSPNIQIWIDELGKGLQSFAGYVAGKDFQTDIQTFATDIGLVAKATADALKWLGVIPRSAAEIKQRQATHDNPPSLDFSHGGSGLLGSIKDRYKYNSYVGSGARSINNPGNLRPVGASSGYNQYGSMEAGVWGLARDLRYKEEHHRLDTITKIVSRFAPPNENDVRSYISDVVKRSGYAANQHLDLSNNEVMAKLMAAIVRHESPQAAKKLPENVIIRILNSTGGSAVVQTSQLRGSLK